MNILREIEERRHALDQKATMILKISEDYELKINFSIVSSKVIKKIKPWQIHD